MLIFEEKLPNMPLDQNSHQTVTRFRSVGFSMYSCRFSVPQMRQFACLHTRQDQNELQLKRWFFLPKSSLSEAKTHGMVNWLQLLNQLNLLWRYTNSSQWCLRNVKLLKTTVNWCWWRFTHTFCHSNNILGYTHCFWLFSLWFIDEDVSLFQFFHKITNIRSWRCFSSSKIQKILLWFSK